VDTSDGARTPPPPVGVSQRWPRARQAARAHRLCTSMPAHVLRASAHTSTLRASRLHDHAPRVPPARARAVRPARTSAFGPCSASASALRRSPAPATHPPTPLAPRACSSEAPTGDRGGLWRSPMARGYLRRPSEPPNGGPEHAHAPECASCTSPFQHARARACSSPRRLPAPGGASALPAHTRTRAHPCGRTPSPAPRTPRVLVGGSDGGSRWSVEVSDGARTPPPPVGVSERGGGNGKGAGVRTPDADRSRRAPGGWGRVRRCRG